MQRKYVFDGIWSDIKLLLWVAAIVFLTVLSVVLVIILPTPWGLCISTGIWAVFLGTVAAILVPKTALATTFGGFLGITSSDAFTGSGLISSASKEINVITTEIMKITTLPEEVITLNVWLFFLLFGLITLRAYFPDDSNIGRSGLE